MSRQCILGLTITGIALCLAMYGAESQARVPGPGAQQLSWGAKKLDAAAPVDCHGIALPPPRQLYGGAPLDLAAKVWVPDIWSHRRPGVAVRLRYVMGPAKWPVHVILMRPDPMSTTWANINTVVAEGFFSGITYKHKNYAFETQHFGGYDLGVVAMGPDRTSSDEGVKSAFRAILKWLRESAQKNAAAKASPAKK